MCCRNNISAHSLNQVCGGISITVSQAKQPAHNAPELF
jgi:hypothetical protein